MKQQRKKTAYNWVWKWHFIGGLVSFPIVFILALTGIIYLFKELYEEPRHQKIKEVAIAGEKISYQKQWEIAKLKWDKKINAVVLPKEATQATAFISGRFSGKSSLYVDPCNGHVTGNIVVKDTDMYQVRKLHGELLTGSVGTKIIELIGSWMIVLILTGLFLFFPRKRKDWIKLIRIRFKAPRAILFRDLHMVSGFWFSTILLLILAGGMPWTDVWGTGFKWVQQQTNTGFPAQWQGRGIKSVTDASSEPISLDEIVHFANSQELPGEVSISLPNSPNGVYSIHNTHYTDQFTQVAIHLDQYSGKELARLSWADVGILMRARMWAMAFHQGQLGFGNWILVLFTAFGLLFLSSAAIVSFALSRKKAPIRQWSNLPQRMQWSMYIIVCVMSVLLPMFGLSVLAILAYEWARKLVMRLPFKTKVLADG